MSYRLIGKICLFYNNTWYDEDATVGVVESYVESHDLTVSGYWCTNGIFYNFADEYWETLHSDGTR